MFSTTTPPNPYIQRIGVGLWLNICQTCRTLNMPALDGSDEKPKPQLEVRNADGKRKYVANSF